MKKIMVLFLSVTLFLIAGCGCADKSKDDSYISSTGISSLDTDSADTDSAYSEENNAEIIKLKQNITCENCRIMGRSVFNGENLSLEWTDSGVEIMFRGTGLEMMIGSAENNEYFAPYISYKTDNEKFQTVGIMGAKLITLAKNLPYGEHKLTVFKITEVNNNPLEIGYFNIISTAGNKPEIIKPSEENKRKILFIGDSITCGYGNMGKASDMVYKTEEQDGLKTYAAITAFELNADMQFLSYSGKGICRNYGGNTNCLIPEIIKYDSFIKKIEHQPDGWIPDLIVINAGTNDVSGGASHDMFKNAAFDFLKNLRLQFKQAKIVWCYGLMDNSLVPAVKETVEKFNASDGKAYFVEFEKMRADEYGAVGHPNVKAHESRAKVLTDFIKKIMKR